MGSSTACPVCGCNGKKSSDGNYGCWIDECPVVGFEPHGGTFASLDYRYHSSGHQEYELVPIEEVGDGD